MARERVANRRASVLHRENLVGPLGIVVEGLVFRTGQEPSVFWVLVGSPPCVNFRECLLVSQDRRDGRSGSEDLFDPLFLVEFSEELTERLRNVLTLLEVVRDNPHRCVVTTLWPLRIFRDRPSGQGVEPPEH